MKRSETAPQRVKRSETAPQRRSQIAPQRRLSRDGFTLIELAVVIAVNSVLMAVAVGLLGTLLRSERTAQQHWEQTGTPGRLAAEFRRDVAAAETANVAPSKTSDNPSQSVAPLNVLRLQGAGGRVIEYFSDGQAIRRVERAKNAVARREAFIMPGLAQVAFDLAEQESTVGRRAAPTLVTMTLPLTGEQRIAPNSWRITARLAKDLRFAGGDSPEPEAER